MYLSLHRPIWHFDHTATRPGHGTTSSRYAPGDGVGSLVFVPESPRSLLSPPGLTRDVGNIISRVAIQSAREGLLSPMHRGVFNLVQRHQAIERDATASFVRSEGVIPADELTAYQTLVDIYHQWPRIFAVMNTVHNEERMNAVQDALTFNAELACASQPNFVCQSPVASH